MGKNSEKKNRVTLGWLIRHLIFGGLPWVLLIWAVTVFIIANNTAPLKAVPMRVNVLELEDKLKDMEKRGESLVKIQRVRAELIIEYINKEQLVKAREQLITYKNWLDTNSNLSLADRIEMHQQLSIIHTSLAEFEPAVREYTLILQDLPETDDPQTRILKARYLNNRGVANFLLSQSSKKEEMRKKYLVDSIDDFRASQNLTESRTISISTKDGLDSLANLDPIVKENEHCLDTEMMFRPLESNLP